jgi:alpha 1,3-glucosidase
LAKETPNWTSPFQLNPSSLHIKAGILEGDLVNTQEDEQPSPRPGYKFELHLLDNDSARVRINERDPIHPRYDGVQDTVLVKPYGLTMDAFYKFSKDPDGVVTVQYGARNHISVVITPAPFKIEFNVDGVSTVVLNEDGLLRFERLRKKQEDEKLVDQGAEGQESEIKIEKTELEKKLENNMWEEHFKDNIDSKPRGMLQQVCLGTYPWMVGKRPRTHLLFLSLLG